MLSFRSVLMDSTSPFTTQLAATWAITLVPFIPPTTRRCTPRRHSCWRNRLFGTSTDATSSMASSWQVASSSSPSLLSPSTSIDGRARRTSTSQSMPFQPTTHTTTLRLFQRTMTSMVWRHRLGCQASKQTCLDNWSGSTKHRKELQRCDSNSVKRFQTIIN